MSLSFTIDRNRSSPSERPTVSSKWENFVETETRQRPSGPVTDATAGAYTLLMFHRYDKTGSIRKTEASASIASINETLVLII